MQLDIPGGAYLAHGRPERMAPAGVSTHQVKAMFHSTAMVKDYDLVITRLGELFGLRVLEYGEAPEPEVGRRGGMTWIGDNSIEVGQPITDGAPPDRFVKRTGGGMHGVAVWVEDFAATVDHLEAQGIRVPIRLERGFGFSAPRTTAGIQFEWSEFTVDEDPRTGAPAPPFLSPPLLDVSHHAFVGAVVEDPAATASQFERAMGLPVVYQALERGPGEVQAAVSLGDCVLALYPLDPESSRGLWGRPHDRPGAALLGLRVDNLAEAREALNAAGVRVLREAPGALVLDPAATADIGVVVVDDLLPGDPRR
jgi:catechol 2,3-dioxygenase-like lactoylglutathione lyase family enzyme